MAPRPRGLPQTRQLAAPVSSQSSKMPNTVDPGGSQGHRTSQHGPPQCHNSDTSFVRIYHLYRKRSGIMHLKKTLKTWCKHFWSSWTQVGTYIYLWCQDSCTSSAFPGSWVLMTPKLRVKAWWLWFFGWFLWGGHMWEAPFFGMKEGWRWNRNNEKNMWNISKKGTPSYWQYWPKRSKELHLFVSA